jgi:glycosyltransferase involved in cell wall biosynthesis
LRALDIFVISSETESFPNGLLEAMACGCSVIGSRAGGIPELITHHSSGLLFESKNLDDLTAALTKLILDTTLRQSLAKQATVVAREQFSMEINARRNEALYLKLLARRS